MYPLMPVVPFSGELAKTGLPTAAFLVVATALLLAGLLALRGSVLLKGAGALEL